MDLVEATRFHRLLGPWGRKDMEMGNNVIDRDFLFLEDTQDNPDDRFGERLELVLDPIAPLAADQPLAIRATLQLDGRRVPVIQFPADPQNTFVKQGVAIAAAVVIVDVEQGLDELCSFALQQESAEAIGGFIDLSGMDAGTYGLCVVARTLNYGGRPNSLQYAVRVAKTVFSTGGPTQQEGIDAVWLLEYLGPQQAQRSIRANLRHFGPAGQLAMVEGALLHGAEGLPLSYPFEKRAIATAPDNEDGIFILSAQNDRRSRLFEAESDGSFGGPEAFPFDSQVFGHSTSIESWVATPGGIGRYFGGALVTELTEFNRVSAIAGVADSTFWALCSSRQFAGNQTTFLRRIDENGNVIAEVRSVSSAAFETGGILRVLADDGVLAYGNYRGGGPHVVRVGPQGNVVAVSAAFPANVLDVGVNPYTGEALVVQVRLSGGVEIIRLNAALTTLTTLGPQDDVFGSAFEILISADISAPASGQRLWIAGRRKERQPSGVLKDRGAVGFLDDNNNFTLVQGGMEPLSLLRALW